LTPPGALKKKSDDKVGSKGVLGVKNKGKVVTEKNRRAKGTTRVRKGLIRGPSGRKEIGFRGTRGGQGTPGKKSAGKKTIQEYKMEQRKILWRDWEQGTRPTRNGKN